MQRLLTDVSEQTTKKRAKNANILEFDDDIWNLHKKCIKVSTYMPSIGLVVCEIGFEF